MSKSGVSIVYTTVGKAEWQQWPQAHPAMGQHFVPPVQVAKFMAEAIVQARLAVCVKIVERIDSVFWWQGAISKTDEYGEAMIAIETLDEKVPEVMAWLKSNHGYDTPVIWVTEVDAINQEAMNWIQESIGVSANPSSAKADEHSDFADYSADNDMATFTAPEVIDSGDLV